MKEREMVMSRFTIGDLDNKLTEESIRQKLENIDYISLSADMVSLEDMFEDSYVIGLSQDPAGRILR